MVVVRLSRAGAKKRPFYHLTVADSRRARDGKFIEKIGYFNPRARDHEVSVSVNKERLDYWLGKGAQLSARVIKLVAGASTQETDKPEASTKEATPTTKKATLAAKETSTKDTKKTK
jgi:small subunit ribosomal protein S16